MRFCTHVCNECAQPTYKTRLREVVQQVAAYFEIDLDELLLTGTNRRRHVTDAREIACWLLLEQFPTTRLETIAEVMGYRERSGVSHAATHLEMRMETNAELRDHIANLRRIVE